MLGENRQAAHPNYGRNIDEGHRKGSAGIIGADAFAWTFLPDLKPGPSKGGPGLPFCQSRFGR